MLMERLKKTFNTNEPIFTEEIIGLFSRYSRVQIFRYIDKAKQDKELVQYTKGVYYIPKETIIGQSSITVDAVARKKYLYSKSDTYGIIGGIKLLNDFSITTQVPAIIEIITNKEATRGREVVVKNRKYLVKKSRIPLTSENVAAYTVMQLFDEFSKETELDNYSKKKLLDYLSQKKVTKDQLLNMSVNFPAKTMKRMIGSRLLNELA